MTAPVWHDNGAFNNGTAGITVNPPGSATAGDLLLLLVETANQPIATPTGWTAISTGSGQGTAGASGGVCLQAFWKVSLGAGNDSSVSLPDAGDHITAIMHALSGVDTTTPIHQVASSTPAAGTSMSWPAVTTTIPGCLIANLAALNADLNSTAQISGWANAQLTAPFLTEKTDHTVTSGAGGGLTAAFGGWNSTGDCGSTTATNATSETVHLVTVAFAPSDPTPIYGENGTSASAGVAGSDITVAWPTPHGPGDIGILTIECSSDAAPALTTANGFALLGQTSYDADSTLAVYWCRATSTSMASPVVQGRSNHQLACIVTIRGCPQGTPYDVSTVTALEGSAGTSHSLSGLTTTLNNELVLSILGTDNDGNPTFSAQANADLSSFASQFTINTSLGDGGSVNFASGIKATAGSVGATTYTTASSCRGLGLMVAFRAFTKYAEVVGTVAGTTGTSGVSGQIAATSGSVAGAASTTAVSGATAGSTYNESCLGGAAPVGSLIAQVENVTDLTPSFTDGNWTTDSGVTVDSSGIHFSSAADLSSARHPLTADDYRDYRLTFVMASVTLGSGQMTIYSATTNRHGTTGTYTSAGSHTDVVETSSDQTFGGYSNTIRVTGQGNTGNTFDVTSIKVEAYTAGGTSTVSGAGENAHTGTVTEATGSAAGTASSSVATATLLPSTHTLAATCATSGVSGATAGIPASAAGTCAVSPTSVTIVSSGHCHELAPGFLTDGAWTSGTNGTTQDGSGLHFLNSSAGTFAHPIQTEDNRTYRLVYNLTFTSGSFRWQLFGATTAHANNGVNRTASGSYTEDISTTGAGSLTLTIRANANGGGTNANTVDITSLSVRRVSDNPAIATVTGASTTILAASMGLSCAASTAVAGTNIATTIMVCAGSSTATADGENANPSTIVESTGSSAGAGATSGVAAAIGAMAHTCDGTSGVSADSGYYWAAASATAATSATSAVGGSTATSSHTCVGSATVSPLACAFDQTSVAVGGVASDAVVGQSTAQTAVSVAGTASTTALGRTILPTVGSDSSSAVALADSGEVAGVACAESCVSTVTGDSQALDATEVSITAAASTAAVSGADARATATSAGTASNAAQAACYASSEGTCAASSTTSGVSGATAGSVASSVGEAVVLGDTTGGNVQQSDGVATCSGTATGLSGATANVDASSAGMATDAVAFAALAPCNGSVLGTSDPAAIVCAFLQSVFDNPNGCNAQAVSGADCNVVIADGGTSDTFGDAAGFGFLEADGVCDCAATTDVHGGSIAQSEYAEQGVEGALMFTNAFAVADGVADGTVQLDIESGMVLEAQSAVIGHCILYGAGGSNIQDNLSAAFFLFFS